MWFRQPVGFNEMSCGAQIDPGTDAGSGRARCTLRDVASKTAWHGLEPPPVIRDFHLFWMQQTLAVNYGEGFAVVVSKESSIRVRSCLFRT